MLSDRRLANVAAGRGAALRALGKPVVAAVAVATVTVVTAVPVGAQVNDDRANATVVTEPLPFTDALDTSGATGEATDPGCASGPGDPDNPTVWYSYTPSADGFVQANTFGSDYDTTLGAYVDDGAGGLIELACNDDFDNLQSRVDVAAVAGETILFMVGAFAGQPGGGQLTFTVDVGQEPLTASVSLGSDHAVTPGDGSAVVSGTVECSRSANAELFVRVLQLRAGAAVEAFGYVAVACNGETAWDVEVEPSIGRFTAGSATVTVDGYAFDGPSFVLFDTIEADIRLTGSRPSAARIEVTSDIEYGFADGQPLLLDLYEPVGGPRRGRPAVIYAHGGGFDSGSRTIPSAVAYASDFAANGVIAASISYRLNGLNYGGILDAQHDMQAAVRWFRANASSLGIDPDRIYVMGHSAGAITSLNTNFNSEDPGSSGTPGVSSEVAGAISLAGLAVTSFIDADEPPILMFHGTADTTVPFGAAELTCATTIAVGNSCDLRPFEGVGHGLEAFHDEIVAETLEFVGGAN